MFREQDNASGVGGWQQLSSTGMHTSVCVCVCVIVIDCVDSKDAESAGGALAHGGAALSLSTLLLTGDLLP